MLPEKILSVNFKKMTIPIIDLTNPCFHIHYTEKQWLKLIKKSKMQYLLAKLYPSFVKRLIVRYSIIAEGYISASEKQPFLNGLSTYVAKLPAGFTLIKNNFLDKQAQKLLFPATVKLRFNTYCSMQFETLLPQLKKNEFDELRFINIAGATCIDNLNVLLLLNRYDPGILSGRKISIYCLDLESSCYDLGQLFLERLNTESGYLKNLSVHFKFIRFDWNKPDSLSRFLCSLKISDAITAVCSEGGMFEYNTMEAIENLLSIIHRYVSTFTFVFGDIIKEKNHLHPFISKSLESHNFEVYAHGLTLLSKAARQTGFKLIAFDKNNPLYICFALKPA